MSVRELGRSRKAQRDDRMREDLERLYATAGDGETVLMTERGEAWSSEDLAAYLRRRVDRSPGNTCFLLGGEDGFRTQDEGRARIQLQLSRLTLPHELARVVLAEQIYRALTLVRNGKYHR